MGLRTINLKGRVRSKSRKKNGAYEASFRITVRKDDHNEAEYTMAGYGTIAWTRVNQIRKLICKEQDVILRRVMI